MVTEGSDLERELQVIGLGLSIGTGGTPISADLVVVRSWDELSVADVEGRIVLMNVPYDGYNSQYRRELGVRAAERKAVAALVRSVTPFSLGTLHTGSSNTATIPSAAITVEEADMLERMQSRGQRIRLTLTMGATGCTAADNCETATSSNVVIELVGTEFPDEIVAIGGHIDSWDVGQGALDDAGGAFVAWGAIKLLNELGLRPKRTIRAIFWNAEENGGAGEIAYHKAHSDKKHLIVLENDGGVWDPYGFTVSEASIDATSFAAMQLIGSTQLARIGAGNVSYGGAGADTQVWCATTPCGSQVVVDPFTQQPPVGGGGYFYFHHTNADYISKVSPEEVDRNVASFAVMAWALAEYGFAPPSMQVSQA
jgi:carboxypeptidase Q